MLLLDASHQLKSRDSEEMISQTECDFRTKACPVAGSPVFSPVARSHSKSTSVHESLSHFGDKPKPVDNDIKLIPTEVRADPKLGVRRSDNPKAQSTTKTNSECRSKPHTLSKLLLLRPSFQSLSKPATLLPTSLSDEENISATERPST